MLPNNWKVVTAGVALTGLGVLGAGAAYADHGPVMAGGSTTTVLAMDDSPWDDSSWD
jgi:hypothetical protein